MQSSLKLYKKNVSCMENVVESFVVSAMLSAGNWTDFKKSLPVCKDNSDFRYEHSLDVCSLHSGGICEKIQSNERHTRLK